MATTYLKNIDPRQPEAFVLAVDVEAPEAVTGTQTVPLCRLPKNTIVLDVRSVQLVQGAGSAAITFELKNTEGTPKVFLGATPANAKGAVAVNTTLDTATNGGDAASVLRPATAAASDLNVVYIAAGTITTKPKIRFLVTMLRINLNP